MNQETVLIVESDILIRGPLAQYLRECGYRVVEATSAAEARNYLSDGGVAIDVVLADASRNHGDGFELAQWVRAEHPQVGVILSGSIEHKAEKAADLCNDGPAVSKPYDHAEVLARIRWLLDTRGRR
jgi:DNA-binding response OmpR family regulator